MSDRPADESRSSNFVLDSFVVSCPASRQFRYFAAVLVVALAVFCSRVSDQFFGSSGFLVVGACIMAVTWIYGLPASAVSVVTAAAASDFFLLPPSDGFSGDSRTLAVTAWYALAAAVAYVANRTIRRRNSAASATQANLVEPNSSEVFTGHFDQVAEGEIYGWAARMADPEDPITVQVLVNEVPVAEIRPVYYRSDVAEHLQSAGRHAFYVDLSKHMDQQCDALIEVRFPDGCPVLGSPMVASIPPRLSSECHAILFMHLAKTAGTAFRNAIVPNYKPSEVGYLYPDPPGFPNFCSLMELPVKQRADLRFVIGHFTFGIHKQLPQDFCYITVVRNPVDRIVSHYLFLANLQSELLTDGTRRLSLPEVLERKTMIDLDNRMVRCFAGTIDSDCPAGTVTQDIYELAIHNLRTHFAFVGQQEQSAASYAAMQRRFGWWATPNLAVTNRTERPLADYNEYSTAIPAIEKFNQWDLLLYQEVLKLFPL